MIREESKFMLGHKSGKQNFANCGLYKPGLQHVTISKSEFNGVRYSQHPKVIATLTCPRTPLDANGKTEFQSGVYEPAAEQAAHRNLAKLATQTICCGCPYAGKTPTELAQDEITKAELDIQLAEKRAAVLRAQEDTRQLEAEIAARVQAEQAQRPPQLET